MKRRRQNVLKQIASPREQVEELNDYLNLLEARARNKGKPTFTTAEVRKQLGLGLNTVAKTAYFRITTK